MAMVSASPSFPPESVAAGEGPKLTAKVHARLDELGGAPALSNDAVKYRPICCADREELEALHNEWFPVRYPSSFYDEVDAATGSLETVAAVVPGKTKPNSNLVTSASDDLLLGAVTVRIEFAQPRPDMTSVVEGGEDACMHGAAAYVVTLGVADAVRGRGIATELLLRAITAAQAKLPNLKAVWLHVVSYNDSAIRLYTRVGFQKVRRFPHFYHFLGEPWDSVLLVRYFADGGPPRSLQLTVLWDEIVTIESRMHALGTRTCKKAYHQIQHWRILCARRMRMNSR